MVKEDKTLVYEAMFLVDPGDAADWDGLSKHLIGILQRHGAEIVGITRWDERKLAYPVAGHKRGSYVLAFFSLANGQAVAQIEHDCRLSEKVLRMLTLRADHLTVADMRMQLGQDVREETAQRLAAQRAGGAKGRLAVLPADAPAAPVRTASDVLRLLAETIHQVRTGRVDPKVGNCVGYLASIALRAGEQGDVEARLAALEAALGSERQQVASFSVEPHQLLIEGELDEAAPDDADPDEQDEPLDEDDET